MTKYFTKSLVCVVLLFFPKMIFASFNFSSKNARIALAGANSQLLVGSAITGWQGTLDLFEDPANNNTSRISGATITFDRGVLASGSSEGHFTGVLDPSGDSNRDTIKLSGHHRFRAEPGTVLQKVEVSSIDNFLEGQPQFAVPTGPTLAIVLADANATLTFNLQSALTVTVSLDDGKMGLADTLVFQDGANIVTARVGGDVDLNGNNIVFGQGGSDIHFSNTINFNFGTIELEAKSELSGLWRFGQADKTRDAHINGHGNLFDLAMGGTLQLRGNTRLFLTDLKLGGLGAHRVGRAGGWIIFENRETATVVLQNVEIELDGNYTVTTGHVFVCGPAVIGTKEFSLIFSRPTGAGTNKRLRVDGTTLWCDGLCRSLALSGSIDVGTSDQFLDAINCGTIKCKISEFDTGVIVSAANTNIIDIPHKDQDTVLSSPVTNDFLTGPVNSKTMRDNMYLAPLRKLRVTQDSLLTGSGLFIHFAKPVEPILIIDAGVTFSLSDVVLKDFSPQHVRYGSATSKLIFGPNVIIELARNDELKATVGGVADTAISWTFKTDSTKEGSIIKGFGNTLDLGTTNPVAIQVDPNATLTLHHVHIKGLGGQQLSPNALQGTKPFNVRLMHPESRLVMRGSTLVLNGNYTFSTGKFDSYDDNVLSGTFTFAFTTSQDLTVRPDSRLILDRGLTFSYDAEPALTVDKGEATKTKIVLTDRSSIFHLNGATLHSTLTGVKLKDGTLRIEDKCFLTNEARGAAESAELEETTLNIEVLAGATLEVDGFLRTN